MTRETITKELIITHLEALQHSRRAETAAKKLGVGYQTFLARLRRSGMPVAEAQFRLKIGETPETIAAKLFPFKETNVYSYTKHQKELLLQEIKAFVNETLHGEWRLA